MRIKELAHGFPCNSACSPTSPWHDCHRCFLALWGRDGAHCRNESGKAPTALDRMWVLNPHAYDELAPLGKPVGLLFLLLAVALTLAGIGWLKHRRWGWQLAVAVIGTQVLGDSVNIFFGRIVQGVMGVAIAGTLLFYITRARVSATFASVKPK